MCAALTDLSDADKGIKGELQKSAKAGLAESPCGCGILVFERTAMTSSRCPPGSLQEASRKGRSQPRAMAVSPTLAEAQKRKTEKQQKLSQAAAARKGHRTQFTVAKSGKGFDPKELMEHMFQEETKEEPLALALALRWRPMLLPE